MSYLLDTNVVSESRRPRPDPAVLEWLRRTPSRRMYVSALAIGELRRGVELLRRRDPARAEAPAAWVDELVSLFGDRVLPVTTAVADRWGVIDSPDRLPVVDGLMAATALVHHLIVVTRNVKDFERAGVAVLDPSGSSER